MAGVQPALEERGAFGRTLAARRLLGRAPDAGGTRLHGNAAWCRTLRASATRWQRQPKSASPLLLDVGRAHEVDAPQAHGRQATRIDQVPHRPGRKFEVFGGSVDGRKPATGARTATLQYRTRVHEAALIWVRRVASRQQSTERVPLPQLRIRPKVRSVRCRVASKCGRPGGAGLRHNKYGRSARQSSEDRQGPAVP